MHLPSLHSALLLSRDIPYHNTSTTDAIQCTVLPFCTVHIVPIPTPIASQQTDRARRRTAAATSRRDCASITTPKWFQMPAPALRGISVTRSPFSASTQFIRSSKLRPPPRRSSRPSTRALSLPHTLPRCQGRQVATAGTNVLPDRYSRRHTTGSTSKYSSVTSPFAPSDTSGGSNRAMSSIRCECLAR